MRNLVLPAADAVLVEPLHLNVQESLPKAPNLREWSIEIGGRTGDPFVGPDGKVWFVG